MEWVELTLTSRPSLWTVLRLFRNRSLVHSDIYLCGARRVPKSPKLATTLLGLMPLLSSKYPVSC